MNLGVAMFAQVYHDKYPWIAPLSFGIGLRGDSRATFYFGPALRFGPHASFTGGLAVGPVGDAAGRRRRGAGGDRHELPLGSRHADHAVVVRRRDLHLRQPALGSDFSFLSISAQIRTRFTMTSTAFSMSWTDTHSRREWKLCSPAKMFGVGSPMNESREPSVPPRIGCDLTLEPGAPDGLARVARRRRDGDRGSPACCDTTPRRRSRRARRESGRAASCASRSSSASFSASPPSRNRGRAASPTSVRRWPARRTGCTNPSWPSVVSGESRSGGSRSMKSAATLIALTIRPFA